MSQKRILVAHADLAAGGGAEAFAKAMIRELRAEGHIVGTLDINGHWPHDGRRRMPWPLAVGTGWVTRRFTLWKYALVCRALPKVARGYDQVILAFGEGPALAVPTLRMLHAPALFLTDPEALAVLGAKTSGVALRLRQAYARLCRAIARPDIHGADGTATLANSLWTARRAAEWHGVTGVRVLYPEVRSPARLKSPPQRDPYRILALGRIVPGKRLEDAVTVTEALRNQGLPARLHVVGRADSAYARRFLRAHAHHPNVQLSPNASPRAVAEAMARARIGFHGYRQEHFGIAVGEMISAGLLPMVYDGGGVCELVPDERMRFRTRAEAARHTRLLMELSDEDGQALTRMLQSTPALTQARAFELCLAQIMAEHLGPSHVPRARVDLSLHNQATQTPLILTDPLADPRPEPGFLRQKKGLIQRKITH